MSGAAIWKVGDRCKFVTRTKKRRFALRYGTITAISKKTAVVELEPQPWGQQPARRKPETARVPLAGLHQPYDRANLHEVMIDLQLHLIGRTEHAHV